MADYKIKFEYKGIGKQASGIRQKVLQAQKGGKKTGDSAAGSRETITSLKTLNSSILKLIASNKALERAIKSGGGPGPGRGPGNRPGLPGGGSAGFGRIGAALPVAGAAIALTGFAVQKINQIGNAYIGLVSQQKQSAGVGGFRRGQGMYMSGELGAGMKSYGMATGQFETGTAITPTWRQATWRDIKNKRGIRRKGRKGKWIKDRKRDTDLQAGLDVGGIYGQSAEESLGVVGQFKRAGANYREAAYTGAGAGIESELPTLLTGMASILTDAVKEGVNTSNMSKDMAKELTSLTMATPGKSVDAALNIIKGFTSEKKQVAAGQMGTLKGMYTAKASQQLLMDKFKGGKRSDYILGLETQSIVSPDEANNLLMNMKDDSTFENLQQIAPGLAQYLLRKTTAETGAPQLYKQVMKNVKGQWGEGPAAMRAFTDVGLRHKWGTQAEIEASWKSGDLPDSMRQGKKALKEKAAEVEYGRAGMGVKQGQRKEGLQLDYGLGFAKTSIALEKSMISIVRTLNKDGGLNSALNTAAEGAQKLAAEFENVKEVYKKYKKAKQKADLEDEVVF